MSLETLELTSGIETGISLISEMAATIQDRIALFNGTGSTCTILNAAAGDFNPGVNDFTIEMALYGGETNDGLIEKRGVTGTGWAVELKQGKRPNLIMDNGIASVNTIGNTNISISTLTYIAITVDRDGNATHYINGVADGITDVSSVSANLTSTDDFNIGSIGGITAFFNGGIDGVMFSDKVRTGVEILSSFNNGFVADGNTIALWQFENRSGIDEANGHDLTMVDISYSDTKGLLALESSLL